MSVADEVIASASVATASSTCSQLSRMRSTSRSASQASTTSRDDGPSVERPSDDATASSTWSEEVTSPSSTSHVPSRASWLRPASSARRVLPMPPTPMIVTSDELIERGAKVGELPAAPDERRRVPGQVAGRTGARRREVPRQPFARKLRDPDPLGLSRHLVPSHRNDLDRGGRQLGRGGRTEDLTSVGEVGESRRQVERADVVHALLVAGIARVEPHADRDAQCSRAMRWSSGRAARRWPSARRRRPG